MARPSSRKYAKADDLDGQMGVDRLAFGPYKDQKMMAVYAVFHPEMTVIVKSHAGETTFETSCGGLKHTHTRLAEFDVGHLKRVTGTFVEDVLRWTKEGQHVNLVFKRKVRQ